jgi:hypothetical protein
MQGFSELHKRGKKPDSATSPGSEFSREGRHSEVKYAPAIRRCSQ